MTIGDRRSSHGEDAAASLRADVNVLLLVFNGGGLDDDETLEVLGFVGLVVEEEAILEVEVALLRGRIDAAAFAHFALFGWCLLRPVRILLAAAANVLFSEIKATSSKASNSAIPVVGKVVGIGFD